MNVYQLERLARQRTQEIRRPGWAAGAGSGWAAGGSGWAAGAGPGCGRWPGHRSQAPGGLATAGGHSGTTTH